ncbi:hypothetical protein J3R83DRAFT_5189 [Lanmaoa asiatica]|nr:hypothetical protein J3R83DRAFT_5189 [Lanmaoa asiatica]
MDVDMKAKEDRDYDRDRDRERDRDPHRDRDRDRRDRDRDRDRERDRDRGARDTGMSTPIFLVAVGVLTTGSRKKGVTARSVFGFHTEKRRKRSRSRTRSRSPRRRSTSPRDRRHSRRSRSRTRSRSPSRTRSRSRDRKPADPFARSLGGPMNADHEEAVEFAKISKRENRVYVGNLSYDVKYRDLMEFMRGAGEVLFAEVLVTPSGVSKGCGIVEFASPEDAQRAVRELSEVPLLGRPVFIREDRENESRFGATPVPGKIGMAMAGQGLHAQPPPRPPHHNYFGTQQNPGNQLYVGNVSLTLCDFDVCLRGDQLPYQAGWQDLKDLFRAAGNIIRADINIGADGRPKGSGTVVFETQKDAQQAISMYNGFDWYGRTLEVREDRYAGLSGPGAFRGGLRGFGGSRGLRGGLRGGFRGGFRGGYASQGSGRDFSSQDIYADYPGPDQSGGHGGLRMDSYGGGYGGGYGYVEPEPSQQIMVRNDLVELFETTGQVELAEILFDGTRSKGCGVVQFAQVSEAETAIAKFQQYMYGGRPLDVRFNDRWHTFTPTAAKGGQVMPMQPDM